MEEEKSFDLAINLDDLKLIDTFFHVNQPKSTNLQSKLAVSVPRRNSLPTMLPKPLFHSALRWTLRLAALIWARQSPEPSIRRHRNRTLSSHATNAWRTTCCSKRCVAVTRSPLRACLRCRVFRLSVRFRCLLSMRTHCSGISTRISRKYARDPKEGRL